MVVSPNVGSPWALRLRISVFSFEFLLLDERAE
jgi:hypothetical protein